VIELLDIIAQVQLQDRIHPNIYEQQDINDLQDQFSRLFEVQDIISLLQLRVLEVHVLQGNIEFQLQL